MKSGIMDIYIFQSENVPQMPIYTFKYAAKMNKNIGAIIFGGEALNSQLNFSNQNQEFPFEIHA